LSPEGRRPRGLVDPRLARRVAVTRRYLVAAVAVGAGATVCLVAQALLLGDVVQRVLIDHASLGDVVPQLAGLSGAFVVRALCSWAGELAAHRTSAQVTSTLRRQLIARSVALGPSWLATERTGELAASATKGVDALDAFFARYLPTVVLAGLTPVVLLAFIAGTDWPSFVILAVTVSVVPLFMVLLGLEAKRAATRQWARLSGLSATFYDLLQGLPTLRAFGRVRAGRRTLERATEEFRATTMGTLRVAFLSSLALEVLASVGTALVALFLGLRLLDGTVHLGMALAVLVLAPEVYLPLRRAGAEFHASAEGQAAAERILDILDDDERATPDRPAHDPSVRRSLPAGPVGPIGLTRVEVRHPGRSVAVLDGVDLTVAPGEHLAVTGESGSGKSTLLGLLLGFVEPGRGAVTVGGVDLRHLSLRDWRRRVAWVPQRPYLVRGTIADNLLVGDPDARPPALHRAVALSGLAGLVERLPRGIDTAVGEGGLTLSAGERQRIALGRAVLRDAPVVLLDEPAAHLDADREASMRDALGPWLEGRTVVVAAHRRGLVGRVDRTVTLVGGRIVEVEGAPHRSTSRTRVGP
jgi:thiol reductant ABC exporter CydD subunit